MHSHRPVRNCDFRPLDEPGSYRCPYCGFVVRNITVLPIHKNCEVRTRWGLGDRTARWLLKAGITKQWWADWMAYLSPYERPKKKLGCSGCERRQEKLNHAGDWLLLRYWGFRGWITTLLTP